MKPQVGDKIRVKTKLGDKLCKIDLINPQTIHFKNKNGFGLTVNADRITHKNNVWRGAKFEYVSFN